MPVQGGRNWYVAQPGLLGSVAWLSGEGRADERVGGDSARLPHFSAARAADSVIFLMMEGGPSHLDAFECEA
ncbi:MAG UNVERIFIED_CONTAM: DUF1501 domain-containing protein [Planctomycetaceae bacterium]